MELRCKKMDKQITEGILRSSVDIYVLYTVIRRLAKPFNEWEAYKVGLIDDKGNILIPKNKRTPEQKNVLTYFDIFVMNLKKLLQKIPGGNNRFVTYAAALWLLREDRILELEMLNEDGDGAPANVSSGGGLARSSEGEAKAFKKKKKLVTRKLDNA